MIRCDYCGEYVSWKSLHNEETIRILIYPDSDLTEETWETCCKKCDENHKKSIDLIE